MKNEIKYFVLGILCGLLVWAVCHTANKAFDTSEPQPTPSNQEYIEPDSGTYHCTYDTDTGEFIIYTQYKFISNGEGDDLIVKGDFKDEEIRD